MHKKCIILTFLDLFLSWDAIHQQFCYCIIHSLILVFEETDQEITSKGNDSVRKFFGLSAWLGHPFHKVISRFQFDQFLRGWWNILLQDVFFEIQSLEAPPQVPSHGWVRNHLGYSWRNQGRVCFSFCRNMHHWSLVEPLSLCQKGWILKVGCNDWRADHIFDSLYARVTRLPKIKERQSSSWRSMLRYAHTSPQVAPPVRLGMEWNRHGQLVQLNFLALGTTVATRSPSCISQAVRVYHPRYLHKYPFHQPLCSYYIYMYII